MNRTWRTIEKSGLTHQEAFDWIDRNSSRTFDDRLLTAKQGIVLKRRMMGWTIWRIALEMHSSKYMVQKWEREGCRKMSEMPRE